MSEATEAVSKEKMSLRKAAKHYNVPMKTLSTKVKKGFVNKRMGASPLLGAENEARLASYIQTLSQAGFYFNRTSVRQMAFLLAERIGIENPFNNVTKLAGYDWCKSFMRRNPNLPVMTIPKEKGLSKAAKKSFIKLLETDLKENKIKIYKPKEGLDSPKSSNENLMTGCSSSTDPGNLNCVKSEPGTENLDQSTTWEHKEFGIKTELMDEGELNTTMVKEEVQIQDCSSSCYIKKESEQELQRDHTELLTFEITKIENDEDEDDNYTYY
ncbi:hypothetical protein DMENIID0001_084420 [Sergentomyia squamirostris]